MKYISKTIRLAALLIVGFGVSFSFATRAATIRVPQDQPTITAGVAAAKVGDTVAVSSGTYYEYNIPINTNITVTSLSGATNTIIDSQHNGRGFIVSGSPRTNANIIGFTIQNGQIPYYNGGGAVLVVTGKCTISSCIIQGVSGDAGYSGGPIDNEGNVNDVNVNNCIVLNNFAANGCGITLCAVTRCLIYDNSAGNNPIALAQCNATNCTVYGNTGGYLPNPWTAGGMSGGNAVNCIFWGNSGYNGQQVYEPTSITYSIVQSGYSGTGNLTSDPQFVNAAANNFNLLPSSPAIDAGDPATPKDPDGSRADIGALPFYHAMVGLMYAVKPSFSYLLLNTNYQLQVSSDLINWTNQGAIFTATNSSMVSTQYFDVPNWNQLFFRIVTSP